MSRRALVHQRHTFRWALWLAFTCGCASVLQSALAQPGYVPQPSRPAPALGAGPAERASSKAAPPGPTQGTEGALPAAAAPPTPASAAASAPSAPPASAVLPPGHVPIDPHANVGPMNPHGAAGVNPHAGSASALARPRLLTGNPFSSAEHIRQAELARSGQRFLPKNTNQADAKMPPGSIGVILRDHEGNPVPGQSLTLKVVKESIEQGNQTSEFSTQTNEQGYAGFLDQNTDSSFEYEVVTKNGSAVISSGPFRLEPTQGRILGLYYYPTTANLDETFVFTRVLYVVEPRDDVFQVQALYRFENTNPIIWTPGDFGVQLPKDSLAFRPGNTTGDLEVKESDGRVRISGSFGPGQHETSFSFQLPNEGEPMAQLRLPMPVHTVDAKAIVQSSPLMSLRVEGLDPAQDTQGNDGQHALMSTKDFLRFPGSRPETLVMAITGLPTKGHGPAVATFLASLIATLGIARAITAAKRRTSNVAAVDRERARGLLLDELVLLERAFASEQIGKKTYEQTRRVLVDALARLDAVAN